MSSRQEKLDAARKKLKQYKSEKLCVEGNIASQSHSHVIKKHGVNNSHRHSAVSSSYDGSESDCPAQGADGTQESQYQIVARLPPPSEPINSEFISVRRGDDSELIDKLKIDLQSAAETISTLLSEKVELQKSLESANSVAQQYASSGDAINQHILAYQQAIQGYEKKYTLEFQYREQLEIQIKEFHETKESLINDNTGLKEKVERLQEIVEEMQEKLLLKTNSVHNLEMKNEELQSSLELANISLKQHRISIRSLEEVKEQEKKSNFEKEKINIQLEKARESVRLVNIENDTLKTEITTSREVFQKTELVLKSEIFSLKEVIESSQVENQRLSTKIEQLEDQLLNVEKHYIPRTEVASLKTILQNTTLEKENLMAECAKSQECFRKASDAVVSLTAACETLQEENDKLKVDCENQSALVERSQNDRTTISRALTQNTELKKLLEETEQKCSALQQSCDFLSSEVVNQKDKVESYDEVASELEQVKIDLLEKTCQLEIRDVVPVECLNVTSTEAQTDDSSLSSKDCEEIVFIAGNPGESSFTQTDNVQRQDTGITTDPKIVDSKEIQVSFESAVSTNQDAYTSLIASKDSELDLLRDECRAQGDRVTELTNQMEASEKKKRADNAWKQEEFSRLRHEVEDKTNHIDLLKDEIKDLKAGTTRLTVLEEELQKLQSHKCPLPVSTNENSRPLEDSSQNHDSSSPSSSPPLSPTIPTASAALQDNYRKLLVKSQAMAKECEVLRYQNSQLDTINAKLAGENDTIGDYIFMYHAQRTAMKEKDKVKSEFIEKIVEEKEDLKKKIYQLQCLLTEFLQPSKENCDIENGERNDESPQIEEKTTADFNQDIRSKLTEVLESVKSVSASSSHNEMKYTPCKCCTGRLLVV